jgi:hemerythrin
MQMTLEWNESYAIGNAEIDAQHQNLFDQINQFLEAPDKASLTRCAMHLFKYTREHFTHEEAMMARIQYPARQAHIQQHNDLISRLNEVAESIANDTLDRVSLEFFLTDWLLKHIGTADARLATYVALQA